MFSTGTATEARHSLASRTYLEYLLRLGGMFVVALWAPQDIVRLQEIKR